MNFWETYLTIDLDALDANFEAIREKARTKVLAVIKADAYGHGAVALAKHLEGKADFYGVASVPEALELRKAGVRTPILIFGHAPVESYPELIRQQIRPAIFRLDEAEAFAKEAVSQGVSAPVHIPLDTGMSRIGFPPDGEGAAAVMAVSRLKGIFVEGLFTHFACADARDKTPTQKQIRLYEDFYGLLQKEGLSIPILHIDNSAGLIDFTNHYNMVRAGIAMYGIYPSDQVDQTQLALRPVASWHSRITMLKTLPAGRSVSYGATYTTTKPTRVATVAVGYADGYPRSLSNRFYVLVCGKKAPILGRVCMDQMMVDVTDIPEAEEGMTVTLIGKDGDQSISVEEMSECSGVFHYELVCGFGRRLPRVYTQGGKTVEVVSYLDK